MTSTDLKKLFIDFFSRKRSIIVPIEAPLVPYGTITISEAASILLTKTEELGDTQAGIHLPDTDIKVYKKSTVQKANSLKVIANLKYVAETHDCDDFAAKAFGKGLGLVWTNAHALNWFIDWKGVFWFVEPQTGVMSKTLDTSWQGYDVRFYIGR